MAVNEKQWVMVRVRKSVHAKLLAFHVRLQEFAGNFPDRVTPGVEDGCSLSDAIKELLRRHDCHAARARASKQRKADAKRAAKAKADVAPASDR